MIHIFLRNLHIISIHDGPHPVSEKLVLKKTIVTSGCFCFLLLVEEPPLLATLINQTKYFTKAISAPNEQIRNFQVVVCQKQLHSFATSSEKYIEVSFSEIVFSGVVQNSLCEWGGIYIFEKNPNGTLNRKAALCDNQTTEYFNYTSTSSELIVAVVSYRRLSEISCFVTMAIEKCQGVTIGSSSAVHRSVGLQVSEEPVHFVRTRFVFYRLFPPHCVVLRIASFVDACMSKKVNYVLFPAFVDDVKFHLQHQLHFVLEKTYPMSAFTLNFIPLSCKLLPRIPHYDWTKMRLDCLNTNQMHIVLDRQISSVSLDRVGEHELPSRGLSAVYSSRGFHHYIFQSNKNPLSGCVSYRSTPYRSGSVLKFIHASKPSLSYSFMFKILPVRTCSTWTRPVAVFSENISFPEPLSYKDNPIKLELFLNHSFSKQREKKSGRYLGTLAFSVLHFHDSFLTTDDGTYANYLKRFSGETHLPSQALEICQGIHIKTKLFANYRKNIHSIAALLPHEVFDSQIDWTKGFRPRQFSAHFEPGLSIVSVDMLYRWTYLTEGVPLSPRNLFYITQNTNEKDWTQAQQFCGKNESSLPRVFSAEESTQLINDITRHMQNEMENRMRKNDCKYPYFPLFGIYLGAKRKVSIFIHCTSLPVGENNDHFNGGHSNSITT